MEVEGDVEKARAAFEQVTKEHARSDAAPGAYYYLGLLTLAPRDHGRRDRRRARAVRARRDALPAQPLGAARAAGLGPRLPPGGPLRARRPTSTGASRSSTRRATRPPPRSSRSAARSRSRASRAQAMEEFQQVRNRFPQSEWAQPALERTTALYRLFGGAEAVVRAGPDLLARRAGDVLKDVRALAVAPGGTLWIGVGKDAERRPRRRRRARPAPASPRRSPRALSLTPAGEIVLAADGAVRVGPKDIRSFTTPPEKPGAAAEARRQDPRRRGDAGRLHCSSRTRSARRSCASTPRASTSARFPPARTRRSAR